MKLLPLLTAVALLATACAPQSEDGTMADSGQINCANAEADLRVLKSEQEHTVKHIDSGGTELIPSTLVTEQEFSPGPTDAAGYRDYLGDRIDQIQKACGL